jgi:hypothetical protein
LKTPVAKRHREMSLTLRLGRLLQYFEMKVSDTHEAHWSGSPGHHAGYRQELNRSGWLESRLGGFKNGEQCFQFLLSGLK